MFFYSKEESRAKLKEQMRLALEVQQEVMQELGHTIQNQQWPNSLNSNFEQKLLSQLERMNDTLSQIKSYQQFILEEMRRHT